MKRSLIFQQIKLKRTEVFFLQETYSDSKNENEWKREWEGQVVLSHLSTTSGGGHHLLQELHTRIFGSGGGGGGQTAGGEGKGGAVLFCFYECLCSGVRTRQSQFFLSFKQSPI